MQLDRRAIFNSDPRFTFAQGTDGKPSTLTGYAMVWNVLSSDRGGYQVRLAPNSAKFATPALALFHHDFQNVLGNTANGTLRFAVDSIGAKVEIDLPDTTVGRDMLTLVKDKYVNGMSFAMAYQPEGKETTENGKTIFDVTSFLCDEVTITAIPAFNETSISSGNFAARREQSLQLQRLRFASLRLTA